MKYCKFKWVNCEEKKKKNCQEAYLQTRETGLPLCKAATNHCLPTEQQSNTNLQVSMSPCKLDTALSISASATGISAILMPNDELPALKKIEGKADEQSFTSSPCNHADKTGRCVRAGKFFFVSRALGWFLNFRSWMLKPPQKKTNYHAKQPRINYFHTQQPF